MEMSRLLRGVSTRTEGEITSGIITFLKDFSAGHELISGTNVVLLTNLYLLIILLTLGLLCCKLADNFGGNNTGSLEKFLAVRKSESKLELGTIEEETPSLTKTTLFVLGTVVIGTFNFLKGGSAPLSRFLKTTMNALFVSCHNWAPCVVHGHL